MDPTSHKNLHQLLHQITQSAYGQSIIIHFNLIPFPLIFFFLFLFFLISLKLLSTKNPEIKNLPPSPPQLPIIGNLHQLGSLPHRSLACLSEKYGHLMLLKLGQTPTLIVSSSKLAKEVMKSHDIIFSSRSQNTAEKSLFYGCRDLAFASYGEHWRQAKKLSVLELLSPKRAEYFQYIRDEEVGKLVKRIGGESSGVINLNQLLVSTSNHIVGRGVLGEKFKEENDGFGEVTRKAMVLLTRFCVGDAFPWFGWIDVLRGFRAELKACFETLDKLLEKVIEERREKLKMGDDNNGCCDEKDFVGIMLKLQQQDALHYHFTLEDFKAILLDMFVGGTDTTAIGLEWTMAELMRNPTIMKKVQEEVRTIVGRKPKIETIDIQKMEYMKCVIRESLRLHPPLPLLLPRETMESVNLEGYHIPPKTTVWINVWAIQRDPMMWENPDKFIPERFMEEKKSVDFKGHDFEFIPFGSGRRKCIGMSFGIASFEYVLANLLHWFDWKLPDGELLDMTEENGLSVFKKLPLKLIPIPFSP
ncbi:cytochrome P450 71A1-like isoform X1 [Cucumis melo var. makuwa]|uniref:Cytochrome P450 71A1-like isoform X1 n=2 Tax=Cucumis melo TaxID=3656 RepID=A0A5D3BHF1_CUCMM|nr:cytochrome P450 71A1-like isoform X1 [Cucumis melo var. makuwa]